MLPLHERVDAHLNLAANDDLIEEGKSNALLSITLAPGYKARLRLLNPRMLYIRPNNCHRPCLHNNSRRVLSIKGLSIKRNSCLPPPGQPISNFLHHGKRIMLCENNACLSLRWTNPKNSKCEFALVFDILRHNFACNHSRTCSPRIRSWKVETIVEIANVVSL